MSSRTGTKRPARKRASGAGKKNAPGTRKPARAKALGQQSLKWARSAVRSVLLTVWAFFWRIGVVSVLIFSGAVAYYYSTLPSADRLLDGRTRGSVTMLDRDDTIFAWRGDQYGGAVNAGSVSPHLRNAVIATEDKRFYRHFGVSPRGIAGAILINLREGRGPLQGHGGSTITQQVAKLLCLGVEFDPNGELSEAEFEQDCRRHNIWRKIKEIPFAVALEIKFTKDEILTIYLNRSYLGAGATGFQAASQRYFGKSASELAPAEAAMLAGLLTAPTRYAPTNDIDRARRRANLIVSLMEKQGYLTAGEAKDAIARPARLSDAASARAGGYFADWVMGEGPSALTRGTSEDVYVRTTYDKSIQAAADEALNHVFETKIRPGSRAQAAIVVMSPDGAVRAMVGGRNTEATGQFNRAASALRQTGSSFKPFVYAAALERGYRYDSTVVDKPITLQDPVSGPWSPQNYDGEFSGRMTLADAFANSVNTVAVQISEKAGRERVRKIARGFGIRSELVEGPALALGTSESTLLEMTGAYAGILNLGRSVAPYGLVDVRLAGDSQPILKRADERGEQVISESSAQQLIYMMNRAVEEGTGGRAIIDGRQAAGKTGTTQAAKDAWFIGFTADYVAGVWMGYDDNTPLTGVTGGGLPAEIWRETMVRIHSEKAARDLPMNVSEPTNAVAAGQGLPSADASETKRRNLFDAIAELLGAKRKD